MRSRWALLERNGLRVVSTLMLVRLAFTTSYATARTAMTTYSSFMEGDGAVQVAASVLLSRAVSGRAGEDMQSDQTGE